MPLNPIEVDVEVLNLRQPVVVFEGFGGPEVRPGTVSTVANRRQQWKLDVLIGSWSPRLVTDGPVATMVGLGKWFLVQEGWSVVGTQFLPPESVEVWVAFENVNSRQPVAQVKVKVEVDDAGTE